MSGAEVWVDTPDDWGGYDDARKWPVVAVKAVRVPDDDVDLFESPAPISVHAEWLAELRGYRIAIDPEFVMDA